MYVDNKSRTCYSTSMIDRKIDVLYFYFKQTVLFSFLQEGNELRTYPRREQQECSYANRYNDEQHGFKRRILTLE